MSSEEDNESFDEDSIERDSIRKELSSMSFEDLQKLKEKIGAKVYKEVVFGNSNVENKQKIFKRENKNRPREVSAKKPVRMQLDIAPVKKKEARDPRFDPLCGEFNKKQFSQDYGFLSDVRINDIKAIKTELRQTKDLEKELKLRRLLQRLKDQDRASKKDKTERERKQKEIETVEDEFKQGRQPHFKNKSEMRVESLVKQYEDLKRKGTGRVQRHLKRRQQKIKKKSTRTPAVGID
ncbi:ribosomal RNA processing protein 36 homolog [Leptidea sinapis]|uniref:ribosomal RNA processing protein 36 homolog n=1 Tax=Leptidea sinapis TaxID=189913 RepID=UPI00211F660C|nr:ribosomal RNA processing protein 36 homolog [Leptidea sinapis]